MRGGIELAAKSVQARSRSSREEVTVNVNEGGHGSHGRSSMVGIVLVVLLVFAGAYYIVTTYIAGRRELNLLSASSFWSILPLP